MNRSWQRLVDFISRGLQPLEREQVVGDLEEAGANGPNALRDLLGLVVRRQAALWWDWKPWLALIGVVGQTGLLLTLKADALSRTYDLYFWIVRNYGVIDSATLHETNLTLQQGIPPIVFQSFMLASCRGAAALRLLRFRGG